MTENEAKTKWCPFARVRDGSVTGGPAINRDRHTMLEATFCIGSACMVWQETWKSTLPHVSSKGVCGLAPPPPA